MTKEEFMKKLGVIVISDKSEKDRKEEAKVLSEKICEKFIDKVIKSSDK